MDSIKILDGIIIIMTRDIATTEISKISLLNIVFRTRKNVFYNLNVYI